MRVYAGIDEAGYGPFFGPLVVGCSVFHILDSPTPPWNLWEMMPGSICRSASDRQGRVAVEDSKKLHTKAAGLRHLERGLLAFCAAAGADLATEYDWLNHVGAGWEELAALPWYAATEAAPWSPLPVSQTAGEIAIARSQVLTGLNAGGLRLAGIAVNAVAEPRFNRMVQATRSKAAVSFTYVAGHLRRVWDSCGQHHPFVAVDRQSGRTHYRELLAQCFPEARLTVESEQPECSAYRLESADRAMDVRFQIDAETDHLPVALASMAAKYTRELLMARFQRWFTIHAPDIKPTAGYGKDGKRFLTEIRPRLNSLGIDPLSLIRQA